MVAARVAAFADVVLAARHLAANDAEAAEMTGAVQLAVHTFYSMGWQLTMPMTLAEAVSCVAIADA